MALIDRLRGTTTEEGKADAAKPAKKAAPKKKAAAKKEDVSAETTAPAAQAKAAVVNSYASSALVHPHVSEKAAMLSEKGVYTFDVPVTAEKISVKKAIEALYGVKVSAVRMIRHAGKPIFRGKRPSARKAWKKAVVTLAKGQKLDLYQGV